jgi:four helix bundle protein
MQNDECRMQNEKPGADLRGRTREYALRIIRLYRSIACNDVGQVLGKQLLRSGTSVGAQYREACRARSVAEFVSKMEGALQELDETGYWLELIGAGELVSAAKLQGLVSETKELTAIFVTSIKTAKLKRRV